MLDDPWTRRLIALLGIVSVTLCAGSSVCYAADDVAAAREHYAKGKRAYDLGHFAEAAKEYEVAYVAKDDPALLFNLGQAHRLAGNYPQAILSYKAYLRNVPDATNRVEVEGRVREAQAALDQQARMRETASQATAPPMHDPARSSATASPTTAPSVADKNETIRPHTKRTWIWGVVAGAVVAVGLGVGLAVGLGVHDKDPTATFGGVSAR